MMLHLFRLGLVGLHVWEQSLDKTVYMTGVSCNHLVRVELNLT
jgi:hypothetical protein